MSTSCRFCRAPVTDIVLDLGLSPISNEFRNAAELHRQPQTFYPLSMLLCGQCRLAQIYDVPTPPQWPAVAKPLAPLRVAVSRRKRWKVPRSCTAVSLHASPRASMRQVTIERSWARAGL